MPYEVTPTSSVDGVQDSVTVLKLESAAASPVGVVGGTTSAPGGGGSSSSGALHDSAGPPPMPGPTSNVVPVGRPPGRSLALMIELIARIVWRGSGPAERCGERAGSAKSAV
jgi:hypothetical protein